MIRNPGPIDPWLAPRLSMVDHQLRARGITDRRVLDCMSTIPRECFVPHGETDSAYADAPLPIGHGQTISQPYMVAIMTQALALTGSESVLEIGTGSGYQTMVLARLARRVLTIECVAPLAELARQRLVAMGVTNVTVVVGDGTLGCPHEAPFDRILVTAGAPAAPGPLKAQLAPEGILVVPVGGRFEQELLRLVRTGQGDVESRLVSCVFVPLIGQYGWESGERDARHR